MKSLIFFVLFALNAVYTAGEDIEDLMLRNIQNSEDSPTPYGFIDPEDHVKFWLHAKNHDGFEELNINRDSDDHMAKSKSRFHPSKKIKVIIHGWMVNGEEKFCKNLRKAYLEHHDYNIITVDWSSLSRGFYTIARIGVHYIGPYVADMLEYLVDHYGISLDDVHIIGHSLGAHVAGAAGAATRSGKIGRITGLDPAAPMFFSGSKNYRLHKDNAQFVDVIHTSMLGMSGSIGHADFYPNGGGPIQPGCGSDFALCTHRRAHLYFAESIGKKKSFPSFACKDFDTFLKQECPRGTQIAYMGEHLSHEVRGDYFLVTNAEEPFSTNFPEE